MEYGSAFDQAVSHLGAAASWFRALPPDIKKQTEEVRLRTCEPVMLRGAGGLWFPQKDGTYTGVPGHEDHPAHPAGDAGYVSLAVCRISLCP